MISDDRSAENTGVEELLEASPAVEARTSATAVAAFVCGLGALLAAPFSVTFALAWGLAALGALTALGAVIMTSRSTVAGRALAPVGLMFSLAALALLGLRYLGVHTAFGDDLVPALTALLEQLNTQLHAPAQVVGHGAA